MVRVEEATIPPACAVARLIVADAGDKLTAKSYTVSVYVKVLIAEPEAARMVIVYIPFGALGSAVIVMIEVLGGNR
jgi:hypothetical protein